MDQLQDASSAVRPSGKRRLIPIVDPRFQWKYTLVIVALGVSISGVMSALLYARYREATRILELSEKYRTEIERSDELFLFYLIILLVLMAIGLTIGGIIVTHRIAGPLYVVARYLEQIAQGRYPEVRPLRKRDELEEFFSVFESAVATLKSREAEFVAELHRALDATDPEVLRRVAARKIKDTEFLSGPAL